MAGYALTNFNKDQTEEAKRTVGAFGGFNGSGVVDFITGLFNGVLDADSTIEANTTKSIGSVVNLQSGFNAGDPQATNAVDEIKEAQA
ncbi:UNVERIFIED_CONTAM: hypothetical protein O8I53_05735 [Campylobacter lari]